MDILYYSNNVIHILLEFFFDTIIKFFFWLDYHNISLWMIIASKSTKYGDKKLPAVVKNPGGEKETD